MKHETDPVLHRTLRRRGFLGVAAGTAAAALVGSGAGASTAAAAQNCGGPVLPPGRLGIQLYTVRDQIRSTGFARLFEELARYDYDEVEFAGYTQGTGDISLAELRRLLHDNGLRGVGSHVAYHADGSGDPDAYSFATNLEKVLDDAEALGLPAVGTPWGPNRYGNTVDAWKRAAEDFNTYGAAARERGLKFYQHNHSEEFGFAEDRPDMRLYDLLLAETDPELVYLEMDIYWAYVGRHRFSTRPDGTPDPFEPLDYVLDAPDRFPLFHVKDGEHEEDARDGYRMVDVGDGDIDYRRFLDEVSSLPGRRRGHHWIVERDDAVNPDANPDGSLSTARRSSRHLRSLRSRDC